MVCGAVASEAVESGEHYSKCTVPRPECIHAVARNDAPRLAPSPTTSHVKHKWRRFAQLNRELPYDMSHLCGEARLVRRRDPQQQQCVCGFERRRR